MTRSAPSPSFLSLPTELRLHIFSYVFDQPPKSGLRRVDSDETGSSQGLVLDHDYSSSDQLSILLTCRQCRNDFTTLAFRKTTFVVTDIYSSFETLLQPLQQYHLHSVRKVTFVASARQFREMVHWRHSPFNSDSLRLDELTVVLHRSAQWLYPSDNTTDMVALLRRLENVKILRFVQNAARVKGFFRTWYNRLIGLILKEDHRQRYDAPDAPDIETTWWAWEFDDRDASFELIACAPKVFVPEQKYMEFVAPLVAKLMSDMESEEWDHDPRARNGA